MPFSHEDCKGALFQRKDVYFKMDTMGSKEKTKKKGGLFSAGRSIGESLAAKEAARGNLRIAVDVGTVALGFLFGGCHLIFGSYPLGLALVSVLHSGVWLALLGVALGSLTLGRSGIIYGMICVLAVFLRIVISGGKTVRASSDEGGDESGTRQSAGVFRENVTLRICTAVICGFVAAIYEILLEGFSLTTVLFGASMVILPAFLVLLFSGALVHGIGVKELVLGTRRIFVSGESASERLSGIIFRVSLLGFVFFTAVSFERFNIFGVDLSFVFAGALTLFAAKRFGPLYGAVAGFFASVGVSGLYSVAFALAGAAAGALFSFGAWYATSAGVALLSVWGAYVGGVSGFLSVFPEFLIASAVMTPVFRYLERERAPKSTDTVKRRATDMVGTMALSHRNRQAMATEELEGALSLLSSVISEYLDGKGGFIDCSLVAKLMNEARLAAARERDMDEELTDKLEKIFYDCGFPGGIIRAFGERKKHFIAAGEDKDGVLITSSELRRGIEKCSGVRISEPEYYRRDDMVLMVADAKKRYTLDGAYAMAEGESGEVSGDTVRIFESPSGFAYGLISDGMGSGEEAKRTSVFVADFLEAALGSGGSEATFMDIMNSVIRSRGEECGASVDLFSLDLINGKASFIKSGAAVSFIKRRTSLFRLKSETVPVGLISRVDAEKISAEAAVGDYVIMLSDGICEDGDDVAWLVELLNKPNKRGPREYAELILSEARARGGKDDKSVLVMKIGEVDTK